MSPSRDELRRKAERLIEMNDEIFDILGATTMSDNPTPELPHITDTAASNYVPPEPTPPPDEPVPEPEPVDEPVDTRDEAARMIQRGSVGSNDA
jgi:hypothetical protein